MKTSNLIPALNERNYKILEIWHFSAPEDRQFFLTGDFRPASKENENHSIQRCSDITQILDNRKSVYANNPNAIMSVITELEQLPGLTQKQFSKDYSYIWHIK